MHAQTVSVHVAQRALVGIVFIHGEVCAIDIQGLTEGQLLDALLDGTPNAALITTASGRVVRWNRRFVEMWGVDEQVLRAPDVDVEHVASMLAEWLTDPEQLAMIVGAPVAATPHGSQPHGSRPATGIDLQVRDGRCVRCSHATVPAAEGADIVAHAWFFRDLTDLRRSEGEREQLRQAEQIARGRLAFLSEAGGSLAASLDLDATVRRLLALCTPTLADWCVVLLTDSAGIVQVQGVAHARVEAEGDLEELFAAGVDRVDREAGIGGRIRNGESIWFEGLEPRHLAAAFGGGAGVRACAERVGVCSLLAEPLVVRGRVIGAVVLASTVRRRIPESVDRALITQLADRAATAMDNAMMFRDVEKRAHAAEVLAHIDDGIFLVDHSGRIRLWNEAAAMVTGLSSRDAIGQLAHEHIPGWTHIAARIPIADSPDPASRRTETLPLLEGEFVVWIAISGVRYPEGVVYAFRDVSAERDVERLRSDLLATVSHELRTPIASVYGAALTLQRADMPLDASVQQQLLAIIASESARLSHIVDDILTASHLDGGAFHVTSEHFDTVAVVRDVLLSFAATVPDGITLTPAGLLAAADTVQLEMLGDGGRLRQVLLNIVENAIKYSPDGGEIEVGIEGMHDDSIHIWVRDHGLGIPARQLGRVFDKFYRLDPQHTRGVGGTGLGLYIGRELVARMGGVIRVESREGAGATFHVILPRPTDPELAEAGSGK